MVSKYNTLVINEQEKNSGLYLKCLVEGMHEWLEIKEKSGYKKISAIKSKIAKEIDSNMKRVIIPAKFSKIVAGKMKSLGIDNDLLYEFRGIFY